MKNLSKYFVPAATFLLILLWVYAAASKLVDFDHFKWEMRNQVLLPFIKEALIYVLPAAELVTAGLLIYERTFITGLYVSLVLMTTFSAYIGLVLLHLFVHVPCSCGGILEHMGWNTHFYFNLFFVALILTIIIISKKGGAVTKSV